MLASLQDSIFEYLVSSNSMIYQ